MVEPRACADRERERIGGFGGCRAFSSRERERRNARPKGGLGDYAHVTSALGGDSRVAKARVWAYREALLPIVQDVWARALFFWAVAQGWVQQVTSRWLLLLLLGDGGHILHEGEEVCRLWLLIRPFCGVSLRTPTSSSPEAMKILQSTRYIEGERGERDTSRAKLYSNSPPP